MKKVYERPTMELEMFKADEYVAACGDTETDYSITCDANSGWIKLLYDKHWDVVAWGHNPCGSTQHQVNEEDLEDGFVINLEEGVVPVKYWRAGNSYHLTKEVNKEDWIVNFS